MDFGIKYVWIVIRRSARAENAISTLSWSASMMAPVRMFPSRRASTGVITAALGVWESFWRVYIWIVPVLVKKTAIVSPLSVSISYFVPIPGRFRDRSAIADIRKTIPKYIIIA